MQNASKYLKAVDDTRTGTGEVGVGIDNVDAVIARGGKFVEVREGAEKLQVLPGPARFLAAESKHNHFRPGLQHLLPFDLGRPLMFSPEHIDSAGDLDQLRSPVAGAERWIDPFHQKTSGPMCNFRGALAHRFHSPC